MSPIYTRKVSGQTLIEVLITVVFITIGVIALARFQNYLSYDNSLSQQYGDATLLAQSKLDQLREFQVLKNTTGYTSYESIASGSSTTTGTSATYTITWNVTTSTNPDYKQATVTVSWTDRRGITKSVILVSNIAGVDPAYSSAVM